MRLQEHYNSIYLDIGVKINAHLKFNISKNQTDLELTYVDKNQKDSCDNESEHDRDDEKKLCKKNDKSCIKASDDRYVAKSKSCRDNNNYTLKKTYPGYKTLSIYDILQLVGIE